MDLDALDGKIENLKSDSDEDPKTPTDYWTWEEDEDEDPQVRLPRGTCAKFFCPNNDMELIYLPYRLLLGFSVKFIPELFAVLEKIKT